MSGYAVVDVETTGLFPGGHDRIVEVAVVHVAPDGTPEESWSTLLNPGRDLGAQHIHGISAADVVDAPAFRDVAGELAARLAGRTFVAHNASFDRRFVHAEFARTGWDVPLVAEHCVCTMQWAGRLVPHAPRALAGCCAHLGIPLVGAHSALADATATAQLLGYYLDQHRPAPWSDVLAHVGVTPWPRIEPTPFAVTLRGAAQARQVPLLERLASELPHTGGTWEHEQYVAMLDRALLDRVLSVREQDGLVAFAAELGIDRETARSLHIAYFQALARLAWADNVLTDAEVADLLAVAGLLGLDEAEVDSAVGAASETGASSEDFMPSHTAQMFSLKPGDLVVFTGEMSIPREVWMERAAAVGLVPWGNVTKKVALVVAADPDSLSGKARKASDYGIPIVNEDGFAQMLGSLLT